ncbi:MAG: hypothetical protein IPH12_14030 [Saprospirales bacterium]|nr:hypothetical protein [Saprospirales bacterium]MBK8922852.1 hypothetical protein [Saprospirales bacterium]
MYNEGQLQKVKIRAFEDKKFKNPVKNLDPNPLELPVNPESYSRTMRIITSGEQAAGTQGSDPNYVLTAPEELRLEFLFDGTETIEGYSYPQKSFMPVREQIDTFLKTVYNMNGTAHKPNFLQVQWGQFVFPCLLSSLDMNYVLLQPDGEPLRVKVVATFTNFIAQEERVAVERKQSPDLTHVRQVKAGDRLDWVTFGIYKDPKFTRQIAQINGLTTLRKVKPGVELQFPPLDKTEEV